MQIKACFIKTLQRMFISLLKDNFPCKWELALFTLVRLCLFHCWSMMIHTNESLFYRHLTAYLLFHCWGIKIHANENLLFSKLYGLCFYLFFGILWSMQMSDCFIYTWMIMFILLLKYNDLCKLKLVLSKIDNVCLFHCWSIIIHANESLLYSHLKSYVYFIA